MKNIVLKGDSSQGIHDNPSTSISASPNVFINGKAVCNELSSWSDHTKTISEDNKEHHTGLKATSSSSSVYVNGSLIILDNDKLTCGDPVNASSANVFSN